MVLTDDAQTRWTVLASLDSVPANVEVLEVTVDLAARTATIEIVGLDRLAELTATPVDELAWTLDQLNRNVQPSEESARPDFVVP